MTRGIGIGRKPHGRRNKHALGLLSGFVPSDIDDCILWLRADLGVSESGGGVLTWADQSAAGNDLTQTTLTNRPTFVSSDAAINDQPYLEFDRSITKRWMSATGATFGTGNDYSVFVVMCADLGAGYIIDLSDSALNSVVELAVNSGTNRLYSVVDRNGATQVGTTTNFVTEGWCALTYTTSTSNRVAYHNGVQEGAANTIATTCNDVENIHLGIWDDSNTWAFDGRIAEIAVYNRELTAGNRGDLDTYRAERYGL